MYMYVLYMFEIIFYEILLICFSSLWTKETSTTSLDSSVVKSPRQELQSVISQIERENRYTFLLN